MPQTNPLIGIGLKVASVAIFVAMQALIKASGDLPLGQIVFFRSVFALLPVVLFLAWRHQLGSALPTKRPFSHIARGVVGMTAMSLGFFGLMHLPLPEAIALNYAQPLLVVIFSAIFLGEVIRTYRWTAVLVGLFGIVIISWPKLTLFGSGAAMQDLEMLGVLAVLASASISAVAMLLVRNLIPTESSATIVIWFSLTASFVSLMTLPYGWAMPTVWQAALLVGAGISGGVAQIMMTEAYRHAEASTVAPFEYTSMIIGIAVGYLIFGDMPTIHMLVGGAIVVASGIFIIWREQRLGLERRNAKQASPPQ